MFFSGLLKDSEKLSTKAKEIIENENNRKLLSIASLWEIAIKYRIGKIHLQENFNAFIDEQLIVNSITLLNIKLEHIKIVSELTLHHRDPFDRLIISQAIAENLPVISVDNIFNFYPIEKIW